MRIDWRKYFYYDETSRTGLRRVKDWVSGRNYNVVRARKGDECGTPHGPHYTVYAEGKTHPAHIVVWELAYGGIPDGMVVDHIDGNGHNNKIENLRVVTHRTNMRNSKKHSRNKSGVTGVFLTNGYWTAQWTDEAGKKRDKKFSVNFRGYSEAFRLACEHRKRMIEEVNSRGAGYTERHGT